MSNDSRYHADQLRSNQQRRDWGLDSYVDEVLLRAMLEKNVGRTPTATSASTDVGQGTIDANQPVEQPLHGQNNPADERRMADIECK